MTFRAPLWLLAGASLYAAEFQSGQAARAVLGQPSFTAREAGVKATSMVIVRDRLYAADSSRHTLTFDLSKVPGVRDDRSGHQAGPCSLCGFAAIAQTNQSVMPGVAAVGVWGKTIAVADAANHRVLLWRDASSPRADRRPDVILGGLSEALPLGPATLSNPVSVALDGKRLFVGDAALHRVLVWNTLPAVDEQPADSVLGQPDFVSASPTDLPEPHSIVTPLALASDGTNLFVADAASSRILVFSPADTPLASDSVINSATLRTGPLAPGTLITLNGSSFADTTETASNDPHEPLPKRLGGLELVFDGQVLPLLSVSPTEVQAQLPYDLGTRGAASVYLRGEHSGGIITVTAPISVKLVPASPGLFALGGAEPRGAILLHRQSGSSDPGGAPITRESPARRGEVVRVWAAGLGLLVDADAGKTAVAGRPHDGQESDVAVPVTAQIDGQPVQVLSARLPEGAIGIYEIEIAIPGDLPAETEARLVVMQNGLSSNTVIFALQH